MEFEYKVLTFSADAQGQASKVMALNRYTKLGWILESETFNQSSFDTVGAAREAACTCFICGPFCTPFLMNKDRHKVQGEISVTLKRSCERRDQESALTAKQDEERIRVQQANRLEHRATIENVMDEARAKKKTFYPDEKIQRSINYYLQKDRRLGGPIPSYLDSRREEAVVYVYDSDGTLLAEYTLED